ncbi:MAG: hypothetical protein ICV52_15360 [Microcoleus sp. C1-bin4]|nr:hypothetical protein [Microcoleus sp. C1-bin4]
MTKYLHGWDGDHAGDGRVQVEECPSGGVGVAECPSVPALAPSRPCATEWENLQGRSD